MIELSMARRMARRAALLAPAVVVLCWLAAGASGAVSAAAGIVMALANLWLAARIIGGVAENNPALLMVGAMLAFGGGLVALTGVAFALQTVQLVSFPVTGFTLIGTHLVLVLWEAARAFPATGPTTTQTGS
jgi:hypothetical protein